MRNLFVLWRVKPGTGSICRGFWRVSRRTTSSSFGTTSQLGLDILAGHLVGNDETEESGEREAEIPDEERAALVAEPRLVDAQTQRETRQHVQERARRGVIHRHLTLTDAQLFRNEAQHGQIVTGEILYDCVDNRKDSF